MTKIKVMVVDDSAFMRKMISAMLEDDPRIEIAATARNGKDALDKIKVHHPDVITLDVEMPVLDGLSTLQEIMAADPVPVVMLSSQTTAGADSTIKAINLGAVDFLSKPSGAISLNIETIKREFIEKVVMASKANIQPLVRSPLLEEDIPLKKPNKSAHKTPRRKIVAIGTSTGGPRALQEVLTTLPKDFPAPILIVQHMPAGFTQSLARRLDTLSAIKVKEAEDGEWIENSTAYIAPGDYHLTIHNKPGDRLAVKLHQSERVKGHRPSVDVMLESLGSQSAYIPIVVIMTGMGADGTKGLKILKNVYPETTAIIEAKETAVVFGMPNAVIKENLADEIAPVGNIGAVMQVHAGV
ncbi:protein-glutamate methylesterase/protein-glutamine glutaminase [Thalassobacillus pellis]|uniref:protein-glutamate methylesterase/protein-glutamine glutaminase n=1 Tax=Thalassobacillus pellis TaxID=748008 RepID=UPI0019613285|nr:chemotaxis response regulator protein-glutamate methylesterase [Thalassobacillus pellis]MBM7552730.1 two-component system chemotaxis response regulator CheB [Thalassobacillus pellis]